MSGDLVNGLFELLGAFCTWGNFARLRKDRCVRGVNWWNTFFFTSWGIWNLWYYPSLHQYWSFVAGGLLVAGNFAWLCLLGYIEMTRNRI